MYWSFFGAATSDDLSHKFLRQAAVGQNPANQITHRCFHSSVVLNKLREDNEKFEPQVFPPYF